MRENVAIFLLLVLTTVAYSYILLHAYENKTEETEEAAVFSAVEEGESAYNELAYEIPSPTASPSPTATPSPTAAPTAAPGPTPVKASYPTVIPYPVVTPVPEEGEGILAAKTQAASAQYPETAMTVDPETSSTMDPQITPTEAVSPTPTPVEIIVDLDYNSDVDDVAALRLAATLNKMGRVELAAVMSSTGDERSCRSMHAQLRYDGLGDVPIGAAAKNIAAGSAYWDELINRYFSAADYHLYGSVDLYKAKLRELDALEKERQKEIKRIEEEAEEAGEEPEIPPELENTKKLRIITTGYLVNVEALLADPEGASLVSRYVESVWVTGGIYLQGKDHNFVWTEECAAAARTVLNCCPVPLIFSSSRSITNEDGSSIFCGGGIVALDTRGADPVAIAYRAWGERNNTDISGGRFAWDPFCVWAASLPREETFTYFEPIHLNIGDDGYNRFSYELPPNCSIIRRNTDEQGWYAGQLELLINAGLIP